MIIRHRGIQLEILFIGLSLLFSFNSLYGQDINGGEILTDDIIMHPGSLFGTSTVVVKEKKRPVTIAIFRNSNSSIEELIIKTRELVDSYLKKLLTTGKK